MNFRKTLFALAIGTVGIMGAMSAHALTLSTGDTLSITSSALDSSGYVVVGTGSWFAMDTNGSGTITKAERTGLSEGTTGLVIGTTTTAGASHAGGIMPGDTNAITAPWSFFGNTGSDYLTHAVTGSTETGLDFSGWTVSWNGVPAIPMGSGAWGTGYSDGVANFSASWYWSGNDFDMPFIAYTLDYHATVPLGDPSGFGGVKYALHLEALPVPEASTYGMMLAGLGLVGFAVRRRKPA